MDRFVRIAVTVAACSLMGTSLAYAQATRTWVSGVGDDANPCSRTAPCKTFAGAISKTAAGGEISVLDPGGFGAVTITKSITLNGDGTLAGILSAGTNGVIINAGVNDVVTLRSLSINGGGTGTNGVRYLRAGKVIVDKVSISGITQSGIDVATTADGALVVRDSSITGGASGVQVDNTGFRVDVSLEKVSLVGAVNGVDTLNANAFVVLDNSVVSKNSGIGVWAQAGAITVENSQLNNNGVGVQVQTGATVRLWNNGVYDNLTGFGCGGGTLASGGNNRKANNTGGPGPACTPTTTITVQ